MSDVLAEFRAAERPDDVALYLADSFVEDPKLEEFGERVDGGVLMVVDGESGRSAFEAATGTGAMEFARTAMATESEIDDDLTGGTCPDCEDGSPEFVFAFAEERNEEVGGIYAEGDVIHAYAQCDCGTAYSDRWVVES